MNSSKIMRDAPEFVYACDGLPRVAARASGAPATGHSRIQIAASSGDVE
jgi:hypothetical protein